MKTIRKKYYWKVHSKNNKRKLKLNIANWKVFSSHTSNPYFTDVRSGVLQWITLSDVFFCFKNEILNCRGPPLVNSKKRIDWRIIKWLIDQKEEEKWIIHII